MTYSIGWTRTTRRDRRERPSRALRFLSRRTRRERGLRPFSHSLTIDVLVWRSRSWELLRSVTGYRREMTHLEWLKGYPIFQVVESPDISPYIPKSPQLSPHPHTSPRISTHLHISPHISTHLSTYPTSMTFSRVYHPPSGARALRGVRRAGLGARHRCHPEHHAPLPLLYLPRGRHWRARRRLGHRHPDHCLGGLIRPRPDALMHHVLRAARAAHGRARHAEQVGGGVAGGGRCGLQETNRGGRDHRGDPKGQVV